MSSSGWCIENRSLLVNKCIRTTMFIAVRAVPGCSILRSCVHGARRGVKAVVYNCLSFRRNIYPEDAFSSLTIDCMTGGLSTLQTLRQRPTVTYAPVPVQIFRSFRKGIAYVTILSKSGTSGQLPNQKYRVLPHVGLLHVTSGLVVDGVHVLVPRATYQPINRTDSQGSDEAIPKLNRWIRRQYRSSA